MIVGLRFFHLALHNGSSVSSGWMLGSKEVLGQPATLFCGMGSFDVGVKAIFLFSFFFFAAMGRKTVLEI